VVLVARGVFGKHGEFVASAAPVVESVVVESVAPAAESVARVVVESVGRVVVFGLGRVDWCVAK
jgi:hypothetical protein